MNKMESWLKIFEWTVAISVAVGGIAGVGIYILKNKIDEQQKQINAKTGEVQINKVEPNLEDFRLPEKTENIDELKNKIRVYIGDMRATFDRSAFEEGKDVTELINFNQTTPIKVRVKDDIIIVTATVTTPDGKIVSEIVNKEWRINPNNYFKKNHDEHGFEVIDEYGITVLQVDYLNKQTIYVAGVFYNSGTMMICSPSGLIFTPIPTSVDELKRVTGVIRPIFKYVGKDSYGHRV